MNISNHHGDRLLSEDSAKQSSLNRVITAALLNLLLLQSISCLPRLTTARIFSFLVNFWMREGGTGDWDQCRNVQCGVKSFLDVDTETNRTVI